MQKDGDEALHAYLRTQFTDLNGAKLFMWKWVNQMDQKVPGFGDIGSRSLAAHCSAVLEGTPVQRVHGGGTNCFASKYGSELYFAAWGQPEWRDAHPVAEMYRLLDLCAEQKREIEQLRKDAERYRWLRDRLAVEDVARLVDEHAQWSWCETDTAESAKADAAVDKAMQASKAVGAA